MDNIILICRTMVGGQYYIYFVPDLGYIWDNIIIYLGHDKNIFGMGEYWNNSPI